MGLYTSPFIVDFRERIQLDGRMIPPEVLAQLAREVRMAGDQVAEELESPREFEFITAVALLYYSRTPCDVVVLEVGLGGRFDATNIIPPPLAVVIPSIGLDHTQLLGDTIQEIAFEKSGVIKGGHPVVVGPGMDPQALKVIRRRCRETGSPLVESTCAHLCRVVCDREGQPDAVPGDGPDPGAAGAPIRPATAWLPWTPLYVWKSKASPYRWRRLRREQRPPFCRLGWNRWVVLLWFCWTGPIILPAWRLSGTV